MSDIPDSNQPIQIEGARFRGPVSEALIQQLGGNMNFLLKQTFRRTIYTVNGSFTAPAGLIGPVLIRACGGGGGGASNFSNNSPGSSVGAEGGYGAVLSEVWSTLNPSEVVAITIGAGGVAALGINSNTGNNGGNGGNTIWTPSSSPAFTFRGARGGQGANNLAATTQNDVTILSQSMAFRSVIHAYSTPGGVFYKDSSVGVAQARGRVAANSGFYLGGTSSLGASFLPGGGGGASDFGNGGNGGSGTTSQPGSSPVSTAYGAGGGGGSSVNSGTSPAGAAGIHGYLEIIYFGGP